MDLLLQLTANRALSAVTVHGQVYAVRHSVPSIHLQYLTTCITWEGIYGRGRNSRARKVAQNETLKPDTNVRSKRPIVSHNTFDPPFARLHLPLPR
jgi:hypothetical protein